MMPGKLEKAAVDAAQRTLNLSNLLYTQGATDYLTVITAQASLLQAQIQSISLGHAAAARQRRSHPRVRGWLEPGSDYSESELHLLIRVL